MAIVASDLAVADAEELVEEPVLEAVAVAEADEDEVLVEAGVELNVPVA